MIKFKFGEEEPKPKQFSDLEEGETFCHYFPDSGVYMKKKHCNDIRGYQTVDLASGQSLATNGNATCIPVDIKATVTRKL